MRDALIYTAWSLAGIVVAYLALRFHGSSRTRAVREPPLRRALPGLDRIGRPGDLCRRVLLQLVEGDRDRALELRIASRDHVRRRLLDLDVGRYALVLHHPALVGR